MGKWVVTGYERITVMMEAKAKAGDYGNVDSEPDPRLHRPTWEARPGRVYANRGWR